MNGRGQPRKAKKPAHGEAGFLLRVFPLERRYANLGHLLPTFPIERAMEPGVSALPRSWPATFILARFGRSAMPRLDSGRSATAKMLAVSTDLHRRDVLGTRAFRTSPFRVGNFLTFMQGVETDTLDA